VTGAEGDVAVNALIVIDIQNDFVPGGALAVPRGDLVVPIANELMGRFDLIVATQDWHPADHGSFASRHPGKSVGDVVDLNGVEQILWPDHCVQGTGGAELVDGLHTGAIERVFHKGTDAGIDSYSGFFDNGHRRATGLGDYLEACGVDEVYVCGLATDYCVKFTALDAVRLGFKTHVIKDCCRGVNLKGDDTKKALAELAAAGVSLTTSDRIGGPEKPDQ